FASIATKEVIRLHVCLGSLANIAIPLPLVRSGSESGHRYRGICRPSMGRSRPRTKVIRSHVERGLDIHFVTWGQVISAASAAMDFERTAHSPLPSHSTFGMIVVAVYEGSHMELNDLLQSSKIEPREVLVLRHRPTEPDLNKILPLLAADKPDLFNAYQQTQ